MMNDDADYDVVIDTLQKHYDELWKMTQQNMSANLFNIMDQIRMEQMDHLKNGIACWKKYKHEWIEDENL